MNSIPVASRSFPRLNELRVQAAETLGIPVPEMYAGQLHMPFGAIFTVGTDEHSFIFVETMDEVLEHALEQYRSGERLFVARANPAAGRAVRRAPSRQRAARLLSQEVPRLAVDCRPLTPTPLPRGGEGWG